MFKIHRSVAGLIVALFSFLASAAAAAPVTVACGAVLNSVVKYETTSTVFTSTSFGLLPGASINVNVASGPACIKVRFFAQANCTGENQVLCLVRALDNGVALNPTNSVNGVDGAKPLSNAFEWVRRVGPGTHQIQIARRVTGISNEFHIKSWTLDVEVAR